MSQASEPRPLRVCDVCGQVDDHPRHEFLADAGAFPVNEALLEQVLDMDLPAADRARVAREVMDTTRQQRHMDCCASVGCPSGTCQAAADTGLKGARLVKHLTSGKGA